MYKIFLALVFIPLTSIHAFAQNQDATELAAPTASEAELAIKLANVWPTEEKLSEFKENFQYRGSLECANCHVSAQPGNQLKDVEDFVCLDEFHFWLNRDPHSRAYLNIIPDKKHLDDVTRRLKELTEKVNRTPQNNGIKLREFPITNWGSSNQLSQNILKGVCGCDEAEISQLFQTMTDQPDFLVSDKKATENPSKLIGTVKQCMSCHAGWDQRKPNFDSEIVKYGTGVSCEGCHGPSSAWLKKHASADWRKLSPQVKLKKYGLYNTRNPIDRSQQCFSCHIGDVKQGKVVTHEMYAAGHPPLPSIEIESFADQMGRHWRYLSEKNFEGESEFKSLFAIDLELINNEGQIENEFPRTKNLLVSGTMAGAQSVELLADSAGQYVAPEKNGLANRQSLWPEFAAFDCAACHHDLKAAGRKEFAGVPGRPPAPYWPKTLSRLGLAYLSSDKQAELVVSYEAAQTRLQNALDRQPFGKPDELKSAGIVGLKAHKKIAQQIRSRPLGRQDAVRVLRLLCGTDQNDIFDPKKVTWDFHSARQLGWAINLVYSELVYSELVRSVLVNSERTKSSGQRQHSLRNNLRGTEFEVALRELSDSLMLELPSTGQIVTEQTKTLQAWKDFNRGDFIEKLDKLREASKNDPLFGQFVPGVEPRNGISSLQPTKTSSLTVR